MPKLRLFSLKCLFFPFSLINPGGQGYCPPYARFNHIAGTLVPIDALVKTGNEASAVHTYHNFIAQAATSVRTEVVPVLQEAVPTNLLVQISSDGPVPPAVAADTNAAAEPLAPEFPADGDQTLLNFSPLTPVTTLEYQGLATILLCPSGPVQLLDIAKPPLEPISLAPQGPPTFVTYCDTVRLARLAK